VIRIRSELVKYFFLHCWSVGVLLGCNFSPYNAAAVSPHIAIACDDEVGLMRSWLACM